MVLPEQVSALLDYLENHPDVALGHCSRTSEGRSLLKRCWMECAQILNAVSVDCPNKTPAEWRSFYNEYKSKMIKRIKAQKNEVSATGGGPAKNYSLTPLQDRLYGIIGRDVGEPLPGVRHNPLTPTATITLPVDDSSTGPIENHYFSTLDEYEVLIPIVTDELVETQEISLEQENLHGRPSTIDRPSTIVRASTIDRPPKRRRRQRSARRYAAEDTDHTALEAAQERLDRIESKSADATLQQAQAINNLAAAIDRLSSTTEKMVDLIGHCVPKKKLRRILESSDSE